MSERVAALLVACGLSLCSASAVAGPEPLSLTLEGCTELDQRELREHLELELRTLGLGAAPTRLLVVCDREAARIELRGEGGEPYPVQVQVTLHGTAGAARERLVALAATELVARAERERPVVLNRAVPLEPDTAEVREVRSAVASSKGRRAVEVFASGTVALDGRPRTTLWGGSVGTSIGLGRRWSLLFDTRFERGTLTLPLADVRWSVLSGFAGPAAGVELRPVRLMAGLGLRAGWLVLDATAAAPHEGRSLTAPWAGISLPLRLTTDVFGAVVPCLGVEAGWVLVPVSGHDTTGALLMEQRGSWLLASVGLGVALR